MTTVIKRDGTTALLDISKIRNVIQWAVEGINNVSLIELESAFNLRIKEAISTREIQDNLISNCLELCSPEEPNWRYVAGRLHIWGIWKEAKVKRRISNDDDIYSRSYEVIMRKINDGIYPHVLALEYSLNDIREACSYLNSELDKDYDYAGAKLLSNRYLLEDELPQEAFLVCALLLAIPSYADKTFLRSPLGLVKRIYDAISQRKISLATPILANLRTPNSSVTSCFIASIEDNLKSIFSVLGKCADISKHGGGLGVYFSKIRATGSWVNGRANSSGGVLPWIKIFNDTAIAVNQGGKRSGALTVALDIWHLDIPEFLEMQTEHGDQRRKAYDVFPQIVIPDLFMYRVQSESDWTLFDPYEVRTKYDTELANLYGDEFNNLYLQLEEDVSKGKIKLYKTLKAKDLFKQIMRCQIETGLPYLAFKDTINQANPNKKLGIIPCTNLCIESFSNVSENEIHCCNLVSLNLANINTDSKELQQLCELAVEILDNTIDIGIPPAEEARNHNYKYRTLGIGVMGLADWLAKNRLKYSDLPYISSLFEDISYFSYLASSQLAKERGTFPTYKQSTWNEGLINCKDREWYKVNGRRDWEPLFDEIKESGMRNSQILAIAPNTSSSLIQGCTASILPTYSRFFYDKAKGNVPIAPPFLDSCFWYYQENKNLDQKVIVNATATIQKWIDTGISMELLFNLNNDITAKDIYETLILAWANNVKAIYYIRSVQKDSFTEECSTCAN